MSSGYFSDYDPKWVRTTSLGEAVIVTPAYPSENDAPFYYNPTAFGEQQVESNIPHASWRHDYGINTRLVSTTVANNGTVTASGSKGVLQTGTHAAGSAIMQTIRRLRYLPGVGGLVRFTAAFTTGVANSTQIIGIGDSQDGFFFGYNGASFGSLRRRAGVDTWTAQTAWNGSEATFDPTNGNIYAIVFQWLGFGFISFYVLDPTAYSNLPAQSFYRRVHTIEYPNTSTDVSILNPTLPIYAQVVNGGNTSNITLQSASATAFLQGGISTVANPMDIPNTATAFTTLSSTDNEHVLTIRNKSTFNTIANRIPISISSIGISRDDAVAQSQIQFYRSVTTAGALSYGDIDTNNSPVEYSTTSTTITAGTATRSYVLTDALSAQSLSFREGELIIEPGGQLTIGCTNSVGVSMDISANINWFEQF